MLPTLQNVRIVRSYTESRYLMEFFHTPVIRLQANFELVNNKIGLEGLKMLELNISLFQELAMKNPNDVFMLVTEGPETSDLEPATYCHWTFYKDEKPIHMTSYDEKNKSITLDRNAIEERARAVGIETVLHC